MNHSLMVVDVRQITGIKKLRFTNLFITHDNKNNEFF